MNAFQLGIINNLRRGGNEGNEGNFLTFSSDDPFSIKFNQKTWDGVLEYSTDKQNWTEWDASEIYSVDNALYLRGTGNSYITGIAALSSPENAPNYAIQINAMSGVACTGNIMTLLDHENPDTVVMDAAAFACMFFICTNLTTAPELPTTTLSAQCYANMFFNCTNLTSAPELPATMLADMCYVGMFFGCSSLTVAPELPATVLVGNCYQVMFQNCTNLTVAPALPATQLANYCYNHMFRGCTNLVTTPELPATVLTENCYEGMFRDCTGLSALPALPATTLADHCYGYMFNGCAGIKISLAQTGIYQTPWRIPSVGIIESEKAFWNNRSFLGTSGTFTDDPSINTTYYQAG